MKLETLFPDEAEMRKVNESVCLGGPMLPHGVFALTRNAPDTAETYIPSREAGFRCTSFATSQRTRRHEPATVEA